MHKCKNYYLFNIQLINILLFQFVQFGNSFRFFNISDFTNLKLALAFSIQLINP